MKLTTHPYHFLTASVILLFVLVGILTLNDYGQGWDEAFRWRSGDLKLSYYANFFSNERNNIAEKMAGDRYPGLFDLPLALFNRVFGGNRMIQGHILSILFGAVGLVSTAFLAGIIFNVRTAFYATGLLAILPLFYGHSMINPKDIPFLATYTAGLAYLLFISKQLILGKRVEWFHFLFCGIAIGTAGATRIPGLVLMGFCGGAWTISLVFSQLRLGHNIFDFFRKIPYLSSVYLLTGSCALLVVFVFFPRAQIQLFTSLPDIAMSLQSSAAEMPLLFAGHVSTAAEGSIFYAHGFFVVSTPLWMLILLPVGAAALFQSIKQNLRIVSPEFLMLCLFVVTAAFPWVYILITHPALHDGMRHMLFAVPPIIIVMAFGVDKIQKLVAVRSTFAQWSVNVLLAVCMMSHIGSLWTLHPYQYVSFNALAGDRSSIPSRYETEYWCTSSKHLLETLPKIVQKKPLDSEPIKVRVSGAVDSARPFVPEGFVLVDSLEEADYYLATTYLRSDTYAEGEVILEIERGGIPIAVIKRLR